MPKGKKPKKRGGKKGRQQSHNLQTRKYYWQFIRTVTRLGRWRGKKASVSDAFCR